MKVQINKNANKGKYPRLKVTADVNAKVLLFLAQDKFIPLENVSGFTKLELYENKGNGDTLEDFNGTITLSND